MTAPDPVELRKSAERYANLGFSVIPLKPKSKVPNLSSWSDFQKRHPSKAELETWFSTSQNIAVVCGSVSSGLRVLDFESEGLLRYCFQDPTELAKHTPVARTGRGYHVWTRQKGGGKPKSTSYQRKGAARTGMPLDVQGEGKYVVAPPSIHPNGRTYEFVDEPDGILEIADEALHAELRGRAEEWPYVEAVLPTWREGVRQNITLGFAKFLKDRCRFDDERVEEIVRRTCTVAADPEIQSRLQAVRATLAKPPEETAAKEWLGDELYASLVSIIPKMRKPARDDAAGRAEHAQYVDLVMRKFTFVAMRDTGEVCVYDKGVYRPGGEATIRMEVEATFFEQNDSARKTLAEEVVDAVRRRTYIERKAFNPPDKLCLRNGVLDLGSLRVRAHARNDMFTIQLPVDYDPQADCPRFKTFAREVLPEEGARVIVQRLFGYCLEPGNPHQTAFMFVGGGNNGKSTLLSTLASLLGHDNVATETFQTLAENRFASARLWDKLANICADIPANAVRYTGTFKGLTGEDPMRGERKYHDAFNFVNPAKLVFSANELPEVSEKTRAFWRRWRLIPCNVDFTGRENRNLAETFRGELPGILNWALAGLRLLREAGGFETDVAAQALMEDWKRRADSLYWFVSERVKVTPRGWVAKAVFYEAYADFCDEHAVRLKKLDAVAKDLPHLVPQVRAAKEGQEGKRFPVWAGIELVETALEETSEDATAQARIDDPVANELRFDAPAKPATPADNEQTGAENHAFGRGGRGGQPFTTNLPLARGHPAGPSTNIPERGAQHPDFMTGLERTLAIRRYAPTRPVKFIVADLVKELRAQGRELDLDELTAGVIKGMTGDDRGST